jgi:hypothetical protein
MIREFHSTKGMRSTLKLCWQYSRKILTSVAENELVLENNWRFWLQVEEIGK